MKKLIIMIVKFICWLIRIFLRITILTHMYVVETNLFLGFLFFLCLDCILRTYLLYFFNLRLFFAKISKKYEELSNFVKKRLMPLLRKFVWCPIELFFVFLARLTFWLPFNIVIFFITQGDKAIPILFHKIQKIRKFCVKYGPVVFDFLWKNLVRCAKWLWEIWDTYDLIREPIKILAVIFGSLYVLYWILYWVIVIIFSK